MHLQAARHEPCLMQAPEGTLTLHHSGSALPPPPRLEAGRHKPSTRISADASFRFLLRNRQGTVEDTAAVSPPLGPAAERHACGTVQGRNPIEPASYLIPALNGSAGM